MKVAFSQVYIDENVSFPFSVHFQRLITQLVTATVEPSHAFLTKYGDEYDVVFNVSAKQRHAMEIRGPSVSKKYKVVEHTLFLPYQMVAQNPDPLRTAVRLLLAGAANVLKQLTIDISRLESERDSIVEVIGNAPDMVKNT